MLLAYMPAYEPGIMPGSHYRDFSARNRRFLGEKSAEKSAISRREIGEKSARFTLK